MKLYRLVLSLTALSFAASLVPMQLVAQTALSTPAWNEFRVAAHKVDSLQRMFKKMQEEEPELRTNPMLMQIRLRDQMQSISEIFQSVPVKAQAAMADGATASAVRKEDLSILKLAAVATGNQQLAIEAAERMLTFIKSADSVRLLRRELCQLYGGVGNLDKAAVHATDEVFSDASPMEVAQSMQALAMAFSDAGNPEKGRPYALKGIRALSDFTRDQPNSIDSMQQQEMKAGMQHFVITQTASLLSSFSAAYKNTTDTAAFRDFLEDARAAMNDPSVWTQTLDAMNEAIKKQNEETKNWNKPAAEWAEHRWTGDETFSIAALKGKVVVIDFFATWCKPCIMAFPHLREWQEKLGGKGLVVIGLTNYQGRYEGKTLGPDEEFAKLKDDFVKKHKVTWAVGVEKNGRKTFEDYGVNGIPHLALIDRKGLLRYVKVGAAEYEQTERMIQKLLAEPAE